MTARVIDANEENFEEEVVMSHVPVLVDFSAPWCGPCQLVAPSMDLLALEYQGRVKVVRVNTDESLALARRYAQQAIPTVALFMRGILVSQAVGVRPKEEYGRLLDEALLSPPRLAE